MHFLSNFRIQPLPHNLAPTILPPPDQADADVFIYSPFQGKDREKSKNFDCFQFNQSNLEVLWVVDTVCQVTVQVQNLLPTELVVHSLILHTEGCDFEVDLLVLELNNLKF